MLVHSSPMKNTKGLAHDVNKKNVPHMLSVSLWHAVGVVPEWNTVGVCNRMEYCWSCTVGVVTEWNTVGVVTEWNTVGVL